MWSLSKLLAIYMWIIYTKHCSQKDLTCDICVFVIEEIEKLALDGATIDQITQAIEQICGPLDNIVPGATHACELLIETQLPQIIDYLLNHQLSPTAICQQLGACSSN